MRRCTIVQHKYSLVDLARARLVKDDIFHRNHRPI